MKNIEDLDPEVWGKTDWSVSEDQGVRTFDLSNDNEGVEFHCNDTGQFSIAPFRGGAVGLAVVPRNQIIELREWLTKQLERVPTA